MRRFLLCTSVLVVSSLFVTRAEQHAPAADLPKSDASTLPIQAKIHIGGDPDWLAVGFGSVWVSVPKTNEIVRINPASNTIQARIKVSDEPCYGIGIGKTHVWVLTCKGQALERIRPWDNKVDATTPVRIAPHGEGAIAVAQNSVWFVGNDSGHAAQLIQLTGTTSKITEVGADSAVVNAAFGSIWVTSSGEGKIYRVDPAQHKILAKIMVPDAPRFTAVGGGSIWVLSQSNGSVSRIDPARNKVVSTIEAGVPGAGGDIAYGGGRLWVAAAGTPLTRIDPQSNQVLEQYGNYKGADAIRFGFGSVWISDHGKGDLWRIDPERLSPSHAAN